MLSYFPCIVLPSLSKIKCSLLCVSILSSSIWPDLSTYLFLYGHLGFLILLFCSKTWSHDWRFVLSSSLPVLPECPPLNSLKVICPHVLKQPLMASLHHIYGLLPVSSLPQKACWKHPTFFPAPPSHASLTQSDSSHVCLFFRSLLFVAFYRLVYWYSSHTVFPSNTN